MSYEHLTFEERYTIARLRAKKVPVSIIAMVLERHRSTIYRELKRNCSTLDGGYRHEKAHAKSLRRRMKAGKNRRLFKRHWRKVVTLLRRKWSPEQISGRLEMEGSLLISHETIYRYIREDKKNGGLLFRNLRFGKNRARKKYGKPDKRGRVSGKKMIDERPEEINSREEFGHWEIDTVLGRGSKSCLLTLVERKTRYTIVEKLDARTVEEANRAIRKIIRKEGFKIKSITADNGTEFHGFEELENTMDLAFYFAYPYHSWERGTNENTNGLLRGYIPKGKDMKGIPRRRISSYVKMLNNRPRKILGFQTPREAYLKHSA